MLLQVQIPPDLRAGDLFNVEAGGLIFEVCVPDGCGECDLIEVDLPIAEAEEAGPLVVDIAVPEGTSGGCEICVMHEGMQFNVIVPDGLLAGDVFAVEVPQPTGHELPSEPPPGSTSQDSQPPESPASSSQDSPPPVTPNRHRRRKKSSGFEEIFPFLTGGTFDLHQSVEVYRTDGTWTEAKVEAYDNGGDTYDVALVDGRIKYMVEASYLRFVKVGAFNKHQAVRVLEKQARRALRYRPPPAAPARRAPGTPQAWVWARVNDYFEDDASYGGSYSVELMDGQKRFQLEDSDLRASRFGSGYG